MAIKIHSGDQLELPRYPWDTIEIKNEGPRPIYVSIGPGELRPYRISIAWRDDDGDAGR